MGASEGYAACDEATFTLDGVKHYLYLVTDNFSRKILSWALSTQLRASIRMETIREAFLNSPRMAETTLVVDGGTENHNQTVRDFLDSPDVTIQMVTAQVEVSFSNSIVEAVNRILKGRYIRPKAPPDGISLEKIVQWAVKDYNDARLNIPVHTVPLIPGDTVPAIPADAVPPSRVGC